MTDEQILTKAMYKAMKNGYVMKVGVHNEPVYKIPDYGTIIVWGGLASLIFSHDFAKAFWGEEKICATCGCVERCRGACSCCENYTFMPAYEYHLQQMVLEKEPLKYLERFLVKCPICKGTNKVWKDGIAEDCKCQRK